MANNTSVVRFERITIQSMSPQNGDITQMTISVTWLSREVAALVPLCPCVDAPLQKHLTENFPGLVAMFPTSFVGSLAVKVKGRRLKPSPNFFLPSWEVFKIGKASKVAKNLLWKNGFDLNAVLAPPPPPLTKQNVTPMISSTGNFEAGLNTSYSTQPRTVNIFRLLVDKDQLALV